MVRKLDFIFKALAEKNENFKLDVHGNCGIREGHRKIPIIFGK